LFSGGANAYRALLNDVNATCGTNYDCDLCHIDPGGGGPLNSDGTAYDSAGRDPCFFCPTAAICQPPGPTCTDNDNDNFFAEANCGTPIDCDDFNAAINPAAPEICDDITDNNCDGRADCADNQCANAPVCRLTDEICDNGVDDDGDRKVDCADKKDCRTDPFCQRGGAEICDNGIDDDGDRKVDCADKKDCRTDPFCAR
jgi:hypothetical protein